MIFMSLTAERAVLCGQMDVEWLELILLGCSAGCLASLQYGLLCLHPHRVFVLFAAPLFVDLTSHTTTNLLFFDHPPLHLL